MTDAAVDADLFREQGFLLRRNVVPADRLQTVRDAVERMIDHRRQIADQRRLPGQPPGGEWAASAQPRLALDRDLVDPTCAAAVELLVGDSTLGVCRQLIDAEHVAPHYMACICSAETHDAGPAAWHRDVGPGDPAPLSGMQASMAAHGPSYLQWNIALYEDHVFWIVPGSHRRLSTEAELTQLAADPRQPLPGAIPVELSAGDGVVYTHLLLHWGSHYSRQRRRTLHPGYRPIGFHAVPNVHWRHWEPGFYHLLPEATRARFAGWDALFLAELDRFAEAFHAVIAADAERFTSAFAALHPSPHSREVGLVMLARMAAKLVRLLRREAPAAALWGNGRDFDYLSSRFDAGQADRLEAGFADLDMRLRQPSPADAADVQHGGNAVYEPNHMPGGFRFDDFVAPLQGVAS